MDWSLAAPTAAATVAASVAMLTDVRRRRIPNWLTGGALVIGLLLNLWLGGPAGGLAALGGGLLGLLLLLPFYVVRGVGAGDVKLLAALGALLGPLHLLTVAAYGALVGGLLSLVIMSYRKTLPLALHQMLVMHTLPTLSGDKAPYAIAIAGGVYLSLFLPRAWGG